MMIYRSGIKKLLNKDGKIFMETHEDLAEQTAALFNTEDYTAVIKKDLSGNQRMVIVNLHSR